MAEELDTLRPSQRLAFVRSLTKADMVRLWDACEGRAMQATDFIPEDLPIGREIIYAGKNSLPLASHFEKRMARSPDKAKLYGYNHTPFNWTTAGPGYYVGHIEDKARAPELQGHFCFDYHHVPPRHATLPATWPKVRKNELGIQRFIYAKMTDYMLKISDGISIGRAWRSGRETSNYFVLVRRPR